MKRLRNIEMQLSYRGSAYFGWQIQPDVPTVQGVLQGILRRTLNAPGLRTIGASRTDTGVHAHDQRVGFQMTHQIPLGGLMRTLNHRLPPDIRVHSIREREEAFSVRYHASGKHYTYFWDNRSFSEPFFTDYMCSLSKSLDHEAMNALCRHLIGTHCFKSFQASRDARVSSQTTIFSARVGRSGNLVFFDVVGHHFLYHMVRNMATSLLRVGTGEWQAPEWLDRLRAGDRKLMCKTAPAHGLHLFEVFYQEGPLTYSERSAPFRDLLTASIAS